MMLMPHWNTLKNYWYPDIVAQSIETTRMRSTAFLGKHVFIASVDILQYKHFSDWPTSPTWNHPYSSQNDQMGRWSRKSSPAKARQGDPYGALLFVLGIASAQDDFSWGKALLQFNFNYPSKLEGWDSPTWENCVTSPMLAPLPMPLNSLPGIPILMPTLSPFLRPRR